MGKANGRLYTYRKNKRRPRKAKKNKTKNQSTGLNIKSTIKTEIQKFSLS